LELATDYADFCRTNILRKGGNNGKGFFMNIDQRPGISKGFSTLLVGTVLGISTALPLGIFIGWLIWG